MWHLHLRSTASTSASSPADKVTRKRTPSFRLERSPRCRHHPCVDLEARQIAPARSKRRLLDFHITAAWHAWRTARRGDIIVAKTDPPLLSVPMAIVAKLRGSHLVNWLQDIFPEVAEALNVGGGLGKAASAFPSQLVAPFRRRQRRGWRGYGRTSTETRGGAGHHSSLPTTGRTAPSSLPSPRKATSCAKSGFPETVSWFATPAISAASTMSIRCCLL